MTKIPIQKKGTRFKVSFSFALPCDAKVDEIEEWIETMICDKYKVHSGPKLKDYFLDAHKESIVITK